MSDRKYLLYKNDLHYRSKANFIGYDNKLKLPINKNYSIFERKTDSSDNNNINDLYQKNYKIEESLNYNQLDKKSNGGNTYELNVPSFQKYENINIINKEIEPYSNKINAELKDSLNNIKSEIEKLKQKNENLGEFDKKIIEFNDKILEYQKKISLLEKDNKDTSNSLKIALESIQLGDKNIINKYNELEKKFKDLDNRVEVIKDNQNETDKKFQNNVVKNENYKDVITDLKKQVNEFTTRIDQESSDKLNKMNLLYEQKNNIINNEIEQLKLQTKNIQEELNDINNSCKNVNEIPKINNDIKDLERQISDLNNKLIEVDNKRTSINKENNETSMNMNNVENNMNKMNQALNEQINNINYIKENYANRNEVEEINQNLLKINNDIKNLQNYYENNINKIKIANENLSNINKDNDNFISKDNFRDTMQKQDNQYNELKLSIDKKINECITNYKNLENYINNYHQNEQYKQSNYIEIIKK